MTPARPVYVEGMADDLAEFRSLMSEARTAIGNGNYDTAETKAMQAHSVLTGLPDSSKGDTSISHRQGEVNALLKQIRRKRTSKLGIQQKPTKPVETDL